jgi:HAMP domain-containing protein
LYNDFSFHGFPLGLDMYGSSVGIIFASTLAARNGCIGNHTNRMRKSYTWVDAGTSIRRRPMQKRTAQGEVASKARSQANET